MPVVPGDKPRYASWTVAVALPPGVIERIVEVLAPEEVWLFGSRARETHGPDSDWDLMAVLPDNAPDRDLDLAAVWSSLRELRRLPAGDPWRERFRPLEPLFAYATAFRYSLSPTPRMDDLRQMLSTLTSLYEVAGTELLSK